MRNDGVFLPIALAVGLMLGVAGVGGFLLFKRRDVSLRQAQEARAEEEHARIEARKGAASPVLAAVQPSEIEKLRAELQKERERAEAAEARLAEMTGAKASPVPKADPKAWRTRADAEWEARVKKVPWRKYTRAIVDYYKELELAGRENRAPRMTPEMIGSLTGFQNETGALAKELGLENQWSIFQNAVVGRQFTEGYVEALAGEALTPEQIQKIHAFAAAEPHDENESGGGESFNWLNSWKSQMEWNHRIASQMQGVLTPEQYGTLAGTLHSSFMVNGYKEQAVAASSPEAAAASVGKYWSDRLGIPDSARSAVDTVASEYTRDCQRLTLEYAQKYGATLPRDRQIELDVKLLDLQIASEKRLAEVATLSEEQKQKALKGSGAALRISYQ